MRLLLDEDAGSKSLLKALKSAGHDVVRSVDTVGVAAPDSAVFDFAQRDDRAIVSYNCRDFLELAAAAVGHRGILLIYRDDLHSQLDVDQVAKAIGNVEKTYGSQIANMPLPLNAFLW